MQARLGLAGDFHGYGMAAENFASQRAKARDVGMRRVLYIGGAARSGTTLLSEIVGAQPGVVNTGELSLFWRAADRDGHCACGEPLSSCELWGPALDTLRAVHGVRREDFGDLSRTRADLTHTSRLQRLLKLRTRPDAMTAAERRLVEATTALMDIVLSASNGLLLVDSSKTLGSLLFHQLCGPVDLRLVHLVRDPRAVVASTIRSRGVRRGNVEWLPPGGSVVTGVVRWLWANATMAACSRSIESQMRLDYESLMRDPETASRNVCRFAGIGFAAESVRDRRLTLSSTSHAAVGNPGRGGQTQALREDQRWRTELSPASLRVVTVSTWPLHAILRKREPPADREYATQGSSRDSTPGGRVPSGP